VDVRVRARSNVQVADSRDAIEAVFERGKSGRLREEHEQSVKTFVEVRVSFGFEELHA
jgi:hypothetical protein